MLKATVNGDDVRRAIAELKEIDPKMGLYLQREIKSRLSGPAKAVENGWPVSSPLSGMAGTNRFSYAKPRAAVSFTPGVARRGKTSTLIGIRVKMEKDRVGAWVSEMAGLRSNFKSGRSREYSKGFGVQSHDLNGQGEAMVNALNQRYGSSDKGGRFGWRKFFNMKSNIQNIGIGILEDYVAKLNREN